MQIRKQFRETCKTQTRQYKVLKSQVLGTTSKEEQKTVIKKLKEEQRRKLALLGEQYEQSISEMLQKQSVSLNYITFFLLKSMANQTSNIKAITSISIYTSKKIIDTSWCLLLSQLLIYSLHL